jgi:outer membrane protein assembly factor BamE (lipoprotein component of BamABCDE complex)
MRPAHAVIPLLVAMISAGCISTKFGREFPSPDLRAISVGKTDRTELLRVFGEPYQVGIDSGDATWRWFFGQRSWVSEQTKDLSVRFNGDGRVKSYSFSSNFPDDMSRLK